MNLILNYYFKYIFTKVSSKILFLIVLKMNSSSYGEFINETNVCKEWVPFLSHAISINLWDI
jgi:hypothetical protein